MQAATYAPSRPSTVLASLARGKLAAFYLVFGLLGVVPLVVLTPPFQVPDEPQHFYRAYQLSELDVRGTVQDGAAGAVLPSSLAELADRFLATRAIHAERPVRPSPLPDTFAALSVPLDPARREFVDFTGAAFYSPLPYVPQVLAIAAGRQFGLGPLGLLYAARLANGLSALFVVAAALRVLPVGAGVLLVLALLPMVLFEFASASPDAAVISAALLFTAVAVRARVRGRWSGAEVLAAGLAGAVFCSLKPVYVPLLAVGVPAGLRRGSTRHVVLVHAALFAMALGITALWLARGATPIASPVEGTDLPRQVAGILAQPGAFAVAVLRTVRWFGPEWALGAVGVLGWLTVRLPPFMYVLPAVAVLACLFLPRPAAPRIGPAEVAWYVFLLCASSLLILVALYAYWTPVGSRVVLGVQGRYFLPLAGLAAVALEAAVPSPRRRNAPLVALVLLAAAAQAALTPLVVAHAYRVF